MKWEYFSTHVDLKVIQSLQRFVSSRMTYNISGAIWELLIIVEAETLTFRSVATLRVRTIELLGRAEKKPSAHTSEAFRSRFRMRHHRRLEKTKKKSQCTYLGVESGLRLRVRMPYYWARADSGKLGKKFACFFSLVKFKSLQIKAKQKQWTRSLVPRAFPPRRGGGLNRTPNIKSNPGHNNESACYQDCAIGSCNVQPTHLCDEQFNTPAMEKRNTCPQ